jgi:hypothetical protein
MPNAEGAPIPQVETSRESRINLLLDQVSDMPTPTIRRGNPEKINREWSWAKEICTKGLTVDRFKPLLDLLINENPNPVQLTLEQITKLTKQDSENTKEIREIYQLGILLNRKTNLWQFAPRDLIIFYIAGTAHEIAKQREYSDNQLRGGLRRSRRTVR